MTFSMFLDVVQPAHVDTGAGLRPLAGGLGTGMGMF